MNTQKFSVVVATYNGEKHIAEQITSIVEQTLKPSQIIITDDGSTDNTIEIVKKILKNQSIDHLIVKNKGDRGFTSNFANGIKYVNSEVVFFCDQDDIWKENKTVEVMNLFSENAYLVIHDIAVINDEAEIIIQSMVEETKNVSDYSFGCAMAVRIDILNKIQVFPNKLESFDIFLNELAEICGRRIVLKKTLMYYRRHQGNYSKNIFIEKNIVKKLLIRLSDLTRLRHIKRNYIISKYIIENVNKIEDAFGALINQSAREKHIIRFCQSTVRLDAMKIRSKWKRLKFAINNYKKNYLKPRHIVIDCLVRNGNLK